MRCHVVYESRLELARLLLADFDPRAASIAAQPFYLTVCVNGKERVHVPDFLFVGDDGLVTVVNVKPAERLVDAKVIEALGWAGAVFAERGWGHEIWTGFPEVLLSNVRFLAAYRDPRRLDGALVSALVEALGEPAPLCEIERSWPGRSEEARGGVASGVAGVARTDLLVPLSAEMVLERAA